MSVAPTPRRRRRPNDGRWIGLSMILCTALVAAVIVVITGDTSGLVDLATLVLTVSAVVAPLVSERRTRRER